MKPEIASPAELPRRDFLKAAGIAGAGAVSATLVPMPAEATPESVMAAVKKIIGDKPIKEERVTLQMAEIAETGGTVPVSIEVASPMTAEDHIKALHIFADENPLPDVANYYFTPKSGKAALSIRVRLAQTQSVVAVAETSKGEALIGRRKIKVTIGGCGG